MNVRLFVHTYHEEANEPMILEIERGPWTVWALGRRLGLWCQTFSRLTLTTHTATDKERTLAGSDVAGPFGQTVVDAGSDVVLHVFYVGEDELDSYADNRPRPRGSPGSL